jgi:predicted PurR-regulated permease PerM
VPEDPERARAHGDAGSAAFGRRLETIVAIAALALLVVGCVVVLRPFFSALLWAMILTYSTWPAYAWLEGHLQHSPSVAALIMTGLLALAFILPLILVATTLTDAAAALAESLRHLLGRGPPPPPDWVARLPLVGPELSTSWRELASNTSEFAAFVQPYLANARAWAFGAGIAMGNAALELSLSVFAAFFLYRDGMRMIERIRTIGQRIAGDNVHHLLLVTSSTIRGVVYGTVGGALAQGVLAALGFWLAEVPGALFLGSLTFLFGLVPGGPPLIWVSVTLWLVSVDRIGWAVFMAVWGFFGISGVDNLIKPYLISRESQMPILVVLLGVLGGALAFGFIGIFLGPTLLGVAYALLVDWSTGERERHRAAATSPPGGPAAPRN